MLLLGTWKQLGMLLHRGLWPFWRTWYNFYDWHSAFSEEPSSSSSGNYCFREETWNRPRYSLLFIAVDRCKTQRSARFHFKLCTHVFFKHSIWSSSPLWCNAVSCVSQKFFLILSTKFHMNISDLSNLYWMLLIIRVHVESIHLSMRRFKTGRISKVIYVSIFISMHKNIL